MNQYAASDIRNVGLFSHGGAGKTSLVEAMLYVSKATTRQGKVEDGNTTTDFDPDEIKRRMSISLGLAPVEWNGVKINLIDTPGYADFLGEVASAMAVVDTALILLDASAGVEVGSENAWQLAGKQNLQRVLFINKMDRENADYARSLESATSVFGNALAPVQIPIGKEKDFRGVVDLLSNKAFVFDGADFSEAAVPAEMADEIATYRQTLVEALAETDETLMMRYLDDEEITADELLAALKASVRTGEVVPVFCGSGTTVKGVPQLLQGLGDFALPASERMATGTENDAEIALTEDPSGPLAAKVFKTFADPHVGRLSYFRVFSGTLKSNATVKNSSQGKSERLGQVFYIRGKDHINTDEVRAGDIAAVGKLADTHTGDTLCDEGHAIDLGPIDFPPTAYSAAVNPKTKADLDKLGQALHRMVEEDPTLQLGRDSVTGETLLSGLGEPHIQIALDRMTRRYGVNVDVGLPRVQYRETISSKTTSEYKHKKQTGGAGQYGHVFLDLEPLPESEFEFSERVVGGSVPRNFFPAVEKGVREALEAGPLAGYPVVNVRVTLFDGSYHDVDSNEMAFKLASKEAFKKGILQGRPTLLEPVLNISITVPDTFTGDVMGDLNSKRAHVSGMNPGENGSTTIEATVPAAEVQRYATDLRSITQGRGSFATTFSHYQPVPPNLSESIMAEAREREAVAH
ncbi:MAG: elongation factor G [Thermomicrobiales bacterium]|nr:elongation factor G [Thermomicrobiales bacterium]